LDNELENIRKKKARELIEKLYMLKGFSLPKSIIKLNTIQEYRKLSENYPENVIIMDFWANWCAPCKIFAPIFEELQQEYSNQFIFTKVNIDYNQILANQYRITGIPTTLFVKKGKEINRIVGTTSYQKMKHYLEMLKK